MKANNIVRIPTSLDGKFFRFWFEFLKPFHNLTDREMDVVTLFAKHRYELSKKISDNDLLDRVLMGEDIKRKIREESGVSLQYFQVIMSNLKKNKVIINNRLNPKFIPNITEDKGVFQLLLLFDLE